MSQQYFKCYINAWISSTRGMTFEQKGFYMDALVFMYERGGPLPQDPGSLALLFRSDRRRVARLLADMYELEKLYALPDGRISNKRAEEEITRYTIEFCRRRDAAKERGKGKDPGGLRPDFYPEVQGDFSEKNPEKPTISTQPVQNCPHKTEDRRQKEKKEEKEERKILSLEELPEQCLDKGFRPHMNGVGFKLSPSEIIDTATLESWRARFSTLDVDAKITALAMWLKTSPTSFWGRQEPEMWMATKLADEHAKRKAEINRPRKRMGQFDR